MASFHGDFLYMHTPATHTHTCSSFMQQFLHNPSCHKETVGGIWFEQHSVRPSGSASTSSQIAPDRVNIYRQRRAPHSFWTSQYSLKILLHSLDIPVRCEYPGWHHNYPIAKLSRPVLQHIEQIILDRSQDKQWKVLPTTPVIYGNMLTLVSPKGCLKPYFVAPRCRPVVGLPQDTNAGGCYSHQTLDMHLYATLRT